MYVYDSHFLAAKSWNAVIKSGSWTKESAGGCRNYPTFANNPQYIIDLLEDDDGDGKCSCLVALMQKNRRKQKKMGVQELCIGFSIYKVLVGLLYIYAVFSCYSSHVTVM